jgi:transmembrane sensor
MDPVSENIYSIIAKSLTEKLTDKEATELEEWKLASHENYQEYNDFVSIWVQSGSLKMPHAIDQLKAQNTISKKVDSQISTRKWVHWVARVAAVFILSILLSGIYSYLNNEKNDSVYSNNSAQPIYQEIKAAYGTQAKVELADGTTVFLNSGSKLRFPLTFNNQNERKVILDGEGFFKVTKNTKHPFIVQTSQLNIKVLGTTFNVDAYADNQSFHIALLEGSVELQNQTDKRHESRMELSPNQVATLNLTDNTISKTNVTDLYKYTAWINGRIVFFGDPIQTIVKKLEKWYNVEIVISDKRLENYSFTGTFIDEPLEQILSILSLTSPMTYDIQPTRVQADNSISKRKIILKSKK